MTHRLWLPLFASAVLSAGAAACGGSTPPPQQQATTKTSTAAAKPKLTTLHYTVWSAGHLAGNSTVASSAQEMKVDFSFNDRGRGPNISAVIALAPDGSMKKLEIKGVNYLKVPVDEMAVVDGNNAQWKSTAEHGTKTLDGKALYVPAEYAPPIDGLLAKALLHAPNQTLPLLPSGEATIKKIADQQVTLPSGEGHAVTLYHITGFDFAPSPIWLDSDEALFFEGGEWFATVRQGYEAAVPAMIAAQNTAEETRTASIAKTLAHKPKGPVAIIHAKLFDPEKKKLIPNANIVIEGAKVVAAGPEKKAKVPKGAEIIDAKGKTVIPGLFDMHAHIADSDGLLDIAAGVTTVRDLANDIDKVTSLKKHWHEGASIGPRVLLAGIIDGPGPLAGPTKVLVSTASAARAAVDKYAERGFIQIKIYSSVDPKLVPVIVQEAKSKKMRVSGHVPAFMRAEDAVKAGFDEIQHMNFLFLNFLPDVQDTRTPARFTAVAENAASLDLKGKNVKAFIKLLKTKKTVVDPTLDVFEEMFTARTGTMTPSLAAIADRLPAQVARQGLNKGLPVPEGKDKTYRDSFTAMKKMLKALFDAGVTIVAGTDQVPGFSMHRELELYAEAGIPTKDVLALATLGAAKVMHFEKELGSVSKGKRADLVILDGDPVADIKAVRKVDTVIKNGVIFKPSELYPALGVKP